MNKIISIIAVLMLWASPLLAQQASGDKAADSVLEVPFEGRLGLGWYGVRQTGNNMAGEYNYLKSSAAGALDLEWDPLPHRFVFESYFLNSKDYFGEADYSYRDTVVLNAYSRGVYHNLNHFSFGPDQPGGIQFLDLNPGDKYAIENQLRRGFLRLKTPDFPLHFYADVRTIERDGTIQQRFFRYPDTKISESRHIDWNTTEYRAGVNAHLGPVEADYSHTEKKFEALDQKELFDTASGAAIPHNLVPDLKSSFDTVKVHTSYSGRVVVAGTYTNGDKTNEDSGAKAKYTNAAGDLMFMPVTSVIYSLRYRHYDLDVNNPDTVERINSSGIDTVDVRDSISSKRDVVTNVLRYRATDRLTLKGEYVSDTTDRTHSLRNQVLLPDGSPDFWDVPRSTTKNTAKLGFSYRVMRMMTLRADYSVMKVDNPAYDIDPDKAKNARVWLTWSPSARFSTMLSYNMLRQDRSQLSAPLGGGSREASRDQALASVTMLLTNRSSITASYGLYKNSVKQTVTLTDGSTTPFVLEPGVPYDDTSHVGSLALTVAPVDRVNVTASATRSYSRGSFQLAGAGSVTNVSGIDRLSDMKVIDTVLAAGVEVDFTRNVNTELRYEYRRYDDEIDNEQDGTIKTVLALLSLKW